MNGVEFELYKLYNISNILFMLLYNLNIL